MPLIPRHIKRNLWVSFVVGLGCFSALAITPLGQAAHAQSQFGAQCARAESLLALTDLLFATGFLCEPLDQALHAAYDPWPTPVGPAPFRSEPAGIAATVQRLAFAGDIPAAERQLTQMPDGALKQAISAALTQSKGGTVEALFLTDDVAGRAFRLGNGFDWPLAGELITTLNQDDPTLAQEAYFFIALGAVLGAAEREAEPIQSIGWTELPRWSVDDHQGSADDTALLATLKELERASVPWGSRAVLYLRLGARQLGFRTLNEDLFADFYSDQCRPVADWPDVAKQSYAEVLALDAECAQVSDFALRNWQNTRVPGVPAPAWPLR